MTTCSRDRRRRDSIMGRAVGSVLNFCTHLEFRAYVPVWRRDPATEKNRRACCPLSHETPGDPEGRRGSEAVRLSIGRRRAARARERRIEGLPRGDLHGVSGSSESDSEPISSVPPGMNPNLRSYRQRNTDCDVFQATAPRSPVRLRQPWLSKPRRVHGTSSSNVAGCAPRVRARKRVQRRRRRVPICRGVHRAQITSLGRGGSPGSATRQTPAAAP
jgi:hypothetical protein